MLSLGALAFASPWLLAGLAILPVLWWLLRVTPPAPRRLRFPAIRLLLGLVPREETPARTPLWLILLRMLLVALAIIGLAHPLLNPSARLAIDGPLLLVVDDGWAAAHDWPARQRLMRELIDQAERENRRVVLLDTAPRPGGEAAPAISIQRASDARAAAEALTPLPWPTNRSAALSRLDALTMANANVVWISDGLESEDAFGFAERLNRLGTLRVVSDPADRLATLIAPAQQDGADLAVAVHRPSAEAPAEIAVRVSGDDGRLLTRQSTTLAAGQRDAEIKLPMPGELRNQAARAEIEGEASAGAVLLLDERWRRRPVGIVSTQPGEAPQPLLTGTFYLERALNPFSEVRRGTVGDLLKRETAMLVLADAAPSGREEHDALVKWLDDGGVLLRFAGPDLAESSDDLLPVTLRRGGRTIGGALSWEQPARLASFPPNSPFAGLAIPDDVTVLRQVLAEPSLDLADKTWARLSDGTPLVTGERRGKGWLVLVHTTGSPAWSNLALSGLFVDMLRRVVGLSQGVAGAGDAPLAPVETLDGYGRLQQAPASARSIAGKDFASAVASASQPPGFYGTLDARHALNLASAVPTLKPLGRLPAGVTRDSFTRGSEVDLRPGLLAAAMTLVLLDLLIAYALRGLLPGLARRGATAALVAAIALASPAVRADDDDFALQASSELRLAYIQTGDPQVDQVSLAGLRGLTAVLGRRTAVESGEPMAVDPEKDELIFFPLIYWPVTPDQPTLSPRATERLNRYLATGGTIFFDTRDQGEGGTGRVAGSATQRLRQIAAGLNIPPLQPVPPDHVLTKSFYLLQEFPGRWAGGQIWVQPTEDRVNDGVSTIIIGSNDYAGAWAIDAQGRPAYAVVPGGEPQREMAYRFGVNLVMYTLTGNYKSDQVHVPAILERLGQ
ncbi:MAG: LytTR family transcriptional regulator [Rhodospirillales bacterium]|nr:LytTR family transcriptional regulator [Rhodospirillales bacterium]